METKPTDPLQILSDDRNWLFSLASELKANPELGFFEFETAKILERELFLCDARIRTGIARTGIVAEVGKPDAPAIVLLADMDALPTLGSSGGLAHSCGHHAQMAVMVAVFRALAQAGIPDREGVRIVFISSPAEEYVDLGRRMSLRDEGHILYLSGKQEMIRLGVFDEPVVVLKYHSMEDSSARKATVNGTLNGFMTKRASFLGKAAHAGACPEDGINALTAASLALQAIHCQRDTFRDNDHIRVHPILSEGGTVVNSVPAKAVIETYVRGASHDAVMKAAVKVDRAFKSGAMALGTSLVISSTPGYQAFRPSSALGEVLGRAALDVVDEKDIDFKDESNASDDIGDVACLLPTCQLGFSGFCGTIHSSDFEPVSPVVAYLQPAQILLRTALLLARDNGDLARRISKEFLPKFSKEEYLKSLDSMFSIQKFSFA
jgi:amidohydrolase